VPPRSLELAPSLKAATEVERAAHAHRLYRLDIEGASQTEALSRRRC
jgi:hypothetical protein